MDDDAHACLDCGQALADTDGDRCDVCAAMPATMSHHRELFRERYEKSLIMRMTFKPDRDGSIPKVKFNVEFPRGPRHPHSSSRSRINYQPKSWDEYDRIMAERRAERWKAAAVVLAIVLLGFLYF